MFRRAVRFFIPSRKGEQHISENKNYKRCLNEEHPITCIGVYDLNKSDYLFEMIILFIMEKIQFFTDEQTKTVYYEKIEQINNLLLQIYRLEITIIQDRGYSHEKYDEQFASIVEQSKNISLWCVEQGIFNYE